MSTPLATYTIAHEEGIDLSRYLSDEETKEVRQLVAQLRGSSGPPSSASSTSRSSGRRRADPKPVVVNIAGIRAEQLPGMTAAHAKEAKAMSERVYPALYVFENSARDVITRVLQAAIGSDWWDKVVPKPLRDRAAQRQSDESKDPWHGKRGAAPINYLDLSDLPSIVAAPKAWPHLKPIFGRQSWFQELVNEFNVSRRVAAHMNPLAADDVKNVEAAFRKWSKTLRAKKDLLP